LNLDRVEKVLDLACGTGLLSELLLDVRSTVAIHGLDISDESLAIGRRLMRARGVLAENEEHWKSCADRGEGTVILEHGSADQLGFEDGSFDLVMMGNAIHIMPDKPKFLEGVFRVLAPGGRFAFNSVFFVGTFPEGSEGIYSEWMKEAVGVLNEKNAANRAAGKSPIPRTRGTASRAFQKGWMSPDEWQELLERQGFHVTRSMKRPVPISQQGLERVGAYGGLAEVLMSGYPVEIASECLQRAVGRAFRKLGVTEAPRNWLEMDAVKPN
jgi:SAM-dependent methyltransferase